MRPRAMKRWPPMLAPVLRVHVSFLLKNSGGSRVNARRLVSAWRSSLEGSVALGSRLPRVRAGLEDDSPAAVSPQSKSNSGISFQMRLPPGGPSRSSVSSPGLPPFPQKPSSDDSYSLRLRLAVGSPKPRRVPGVGKGRGRSGNSNDGATRRLQC